MKKRLMASMLSLLLCVSMLVGSTFAWFTDTATTGVNTIQAGKLDVDLVFAKDWNGNDAGSTAVGKTLEFLKADGAPAGEKILWEPGCTYELPALRVINKGNLTLKFKVAITGIGGSAKLNEAIEWKVNDAAMESTVNDLFGEKTLEPGEDFDFTISGHMKEAAGNEYQGESITNVGITVYATQETAEFDSFNNTYDEGATYPVIPNVVGATLSAKTDVEAGTGLASDVVVEDNAAGVTVTVPAANYAADPNEAKTYTTDVTVELTDSSDASTTYEVDVKITDNKGNPVSLTAPATVEIELIADLENVVVTHNGAAMTEVSNNAFTADQQYSYDKSTGILTIYSQTFSPFKIAYETNYQASINGKGYLSLRTALLEAQPGDTVVVQQDWGYNYSTSYALVVDTEDVTLDLGGNIVASQNKYVIAVLAQNFTVKNGTIQALGTGGNQTAVMFQGVNGTAEDVDIKINRPTSETAGYNTGISVLTFDLDGYRNADVTLNNVTIKEIAKDGAEGATVGVYVQGANIETDTLYENTAAATINGCDISVSGFALGGNGSVHGTKFVVKDSEVMSTSSAVYHPQYGDMIVENSNITGETAIEMRSGNLTVTSGTITGTGDPFAAEGNLSGATMLGSAIAVSQHTTEMPINVTINGGTLKGVYAVYEDDLVENQTEKSKDVSIVINGGTIEGELKSVNNKITDNRSA